LNGCGAHEQFFSRCFLESVIGHLGPALAPFAVALGAAALLTLLAIPIGRRTGWVKKVRDRDIHTRPIPDIGGLALYGAFALAAILFAPSSDYRTGMLVLGLAGVAIMFVDDRVQVHAWIKLGVQAALALVAAEAFAPNVFQITYLTLPGFDHPVSIGLLALPLTLLWLVGMQNTVNLLDGVDGLAAGVVAIVALTLLVAASTRGPEDPVLLAAALAGACLGFLLFNWHPARIFMGDSGSNFLGLMLGLLSVAGVAKVTAAFALFIPVLALGVPIVDTAWAIVRRRRQRISIAHPDTRHIHHQLLDFGLSQRETCIVFYCATGILGAVGLTLFHHRRILAITIVMLIVVLSTIVAEHLERAEWRIPAPGLRRLLTAPTVRSRL
jgi:UDP-GlcNAc:undecaprenyl-phosphate/decaprenyl-phosphate GlcNAc-1-phosphate transferase